MTVIPFAFLLVALVVLALIGLDFALVALVMLVGGLLGAALAYLLTAFLLPWGRSVAFVLVLLYFMLPFFDLLVLRPRGYGLYPETGTLLSASVQGFLYGLLPVAILGLLSPSSLRSRRRNFENANRR